jgi:hypothetical protein
MRRANKRLNRQRGHREADRQHALALLASCRDGCPEALMLAHGFTARRLAAIKDGEG